MVGRVGWLRERARDLGGWLRFLVACLVCGVALLLPYRLRVWYAGLVAWIVHAPVILFGRMGRSLLAKLARFPPPHNILMVLSAGGTHRVVQPLLSIPNRRCLRPTRTLPEERGIRRSFAGKESWN